MKTTSIIGAVVLCMSMLTASAHATILFKGKGVNTSGAKKVLFKTGAVRHDAGMSQLYSPVVGKTGSKFTVFTRKLPSRNGHIFMLRTETNRFRHYTNSAVYGDGSNDRGYVRSHPDARVKMVTVRKISPTQMMKLYKGMQRFAPSSPMKR